LTYLERVLARCESLNAYEVVFHRRERRGLFNQLSEWERMKVYFRAKPLAVKMVWLDEGSEYAEAVYREDANDGKVLVLPRRGLFGLPPRVGAYPPVEAVRWGKSLRPITHFGLASMMRRTLEKIREARSRGGAVVLYRGRARLSRTGRVVHHFEIKYPKGFTRAARQDLYIDAETSLPAGTELWLPDGNLLAAYFYEPPVVRNLPDEVFQISAD